MTDKKPSVTERDAVEIDKALDKFAADVRRAGAAWVTGRADIHAVTAFLFLGFADLRERINKIRGRP